MHIKYILAAVAALLAHNVHTDMYTADVRQALCYILTASDENTLIISNVDMPNMAHIYERLHDSIEQEIKNAAKARRRDIGELLSTVKKLMQAVNPIYIAVAKTSPNTIGVTQRSLRWAHFLNQVCEQEEIYNSPRRLAIVIPENETMSERAREIECNASIIYLEKTQAADAIHNYINT